MSDKNSVIDSQEEWKESLRKLEENCEAVRRRSFQPEDWNDIPNQLEILDNLERAVSLVRATYPPTPNGSSFKIPVQNLSQEFIEQRIVSQFEYAVSIMRRGGSVERRKELVLSAVGTAVNFALTVGDLKTYLFLAEQLTKYNIRCY